MNDAEKRLWLGLALAGEIALWLALLGLLAWVACRP
jgi:hypothetical protein